MVSPILECTPRRKVGAWTFPLRALAREPVPALNSLRPSHRKLPARRRDMGETFRGHGTLLSQNARRLTTGTGFAELQPGAIDLASILIRGSQVVSEGGRQMGRIARFCRGGPDVTVSARFHGRGCDFLIRRTRRAQRRLKRPDPNENCQGDELTFDEDKVRALLDFCRCGDRGI